MTDDDPMPVFVLQAKDDLARRAVLEYATECGARGLRRQADQVQRALDEFEDWRRRHPDLCGLPDHEHVPAAPPDELGRMFGVADRLSLRVYDLVRVIRRVLERHTTIAGQRGGRGTLRVEDERELREALNAATSGAASARDLLGIDPSYDNTIGQQFADDLAERALASDTEPPVLVAGEDVAAQWVLVPREHLRTIQGWDGDIDEVEAVLMCAAILADARLLDQS